jgi:hypothetical protein
MIGATALIAAFQYVYVATDLLLDFAIRTTMPYERPIAHCRVVRSRQTVGVRIYEGVFENGAKQMPLRHYKRIRHPAFVQQDTK